MNDPIPYAERKPIDRIERLAAASKKGRNLVSLERSLLYLESYGETEGGPVIIRRAKALRHILENIPIRIDPDEIIIGGRTPYPKMGVPSLEGSVDWLMDELDTVSRRSQEPFSFSEEDKAAFKNVLYPAFKGTTLKDRIAGELPRDVSDCVESGVFALHQTTHSQGHILPDTEKWLTLGINGLIGEVEAAGSGSSGKNRDFYEAVLVTLDAAKRFILRYGDLAARMGRLAVREVCDKIASGVPETFMEAVQSLWFLFVILHTESIGSSFSPGRLDQTLYPFYKRERERGTLNDETALDIIEAFFVKCNEIVLFRSESAAKYFAGFPIGFNITLGGTNGKGENTINELSYLFLKAEADLGLPQPNLSVRIGSKTPSRFFDACGFVIRRGSGMPQVFNDDAIVPALKNRGVAREDARNYALIGCVEIGIPGMHLGLSDAAMLNFARLFEVSLRDKIHQRFAGLERTVSANMEYYVKKMAEGCNIVDRLHAEVLPTPFLSAVVSDCIEKGTDVTAGGARYNFTGPQGVGIANIADSMYAVKKAVFDDKKIAYSALLKVLDNNFDGNEMLRYRLMNRIPKYGNNIREVDDMANKWSRKYNREVTKYKNPRGGSFSPGLYTVSAHVPLGMNVGATPDGRLKGEPLADGGLSPMRGRDKRGPIAVIQSVSRVDLKNASNGALLNIKFHPSVFEGDEGLSKFTDFLRGFVAYGNIHVQFNVLSADTLKKAKENPEEYSDLVVRVAGYSAFFVDLNEALQDDIIERTEHAG
ncbi:MAG: formate C-acetyltransferase/glycerol dehydratase family glycyl radical enzyme [Spirochaetes bacterium]|nr:formate C-acetyltransferase/glycerol dehydratase family glycyl radical enzyme [Spirochaetota bacterium]